MKRKFEEINTAQEQGNLSTLKQTIGAQEDENHSSLYGNDAKRLRLEN